MYNIISQKNPDAVWIIQIIIESSHIHSNVGPESVVYFIDIVKFFWDTHNQSY